MGKILVKNADWVITMDAEKRRIRNGDILIEGPEISMVANEIEEPGDIEWILQVGRYHPLIDHFLLQLPAYG